MTIQIKQWRIISINILIILYIVDTLASSNNLVLKITVLGEFVWKKFHRNDLSNFQLANGHSATILNEEEDVILFFGNNYGASKELSFLTLG